MAEPLGFFFPEPTSVSHGGLQHRRAIAQALAARRMKLPTTVGEGLTYFGESLADAAGTIRLGQIEQAYEAKQEALRKQLAADPDAAPSPAAAPPSGRAAAGPDVTVGDPGAVEQSTPDGASFAFPPMPGAPSTAGDEGQATGPNPPIVRPDIRTAPVPGTTAAPLPDASSFPPVDKSPPPSLGRTPLPADANTLREVVAPTLPPMGKRERDAFAVMNSTDDPNTKAIAKAVMDQERQRRLDAHERNVKQFDADVQLRNAMRLQQQKAAIDQPVTEGTLREQEEKLRHTAEQNVLKSRLGGRDPEKFFAEMDKDKASAMQTNNILQQAALARSAIAGGVITGYGANQRVDLQRLQAWMLNNKASGDVVSNTERMKAALDNMLNLAVQNIQGGDSRVTEGDIAIARGLTGADITKQQETIQRILHNNERIAREKLNDYEDRRDYYLKGTRAERFYHTPVQQTADPTAIANLLKYDSEADRHEFDKRFGGGAAALEIARAKRRERERDR